MLSDFRVVLEAEHGLWRAHGTLVRDADARLGVLLVAPPKSGKSNIADRLLQRRRWELVVNDFLEWTVRGDQIYGGLRFSNQPAQFWFRDAGGIKIFRDIWDKREWVRIGAVCSISETRVSGEDPALEKANDLAYWGDLMDGGRSGRWKSLPAEQLAPITKTVVLPEQLSSAAFDAAANIIDATDWHEDSESSSDSQIIVQLNALYEKLDAYQADNK